MSFLSWLNRHELLHDDTKPLPGGPHGLRLMTLTLLRIAMLTPDCNQEPLNTRLAHIAWRHVAPCISVSI